MAERIGIGDTPWVPDELIGKCAGGGVCKGEGGMSNYMQTNTDRLRPEWGAGVIYAPQKTQKPGEIRVSEMTQIVVTAAAD